MSMFKHKSKEEYKKYVEKLNNNLIVFVFKERKHSGVTTNDDFYEYLDFATTQFFGNSNEKFQKFIDNLFNKGEIEEQSIKLGIEYDTFQLYFYNQYGSLSVDWEKYFNNLKNNKKPLTVPMQKVNEYIKTHQPYVANKWAKKESRKDYIARNLEKEMEKYNKGNSKAINK